MAELIFVYGEFLEPKIRQKVIGRSVKGIQDSITGYRKITTPYKGINYYFIRKEKNSAAIGLILKVFKNELLKMDDYEDELYTRKKIVTKKGISTWIYMPSQEMVTEILNLPSL